jgi:hypothetical protein
MAGLPLHFPPASPGGAAPSGSVRPWGYYQAKEIKAAVAEASRDAWAVIGKPVPPQFA